MNILVIGSGGREHALVMKLAESPRTTKLFCAPGNGGIAKYAECMPEVSPTDLDAVLRAAVRTDADLVVVAPDDPLVAGAVDALEAKGIKTFGPTKAAAAIEGSKAFSKDLMRRYHIPTAGHETFHEADAAIAYIREQGQFPVVIKADGLALGKGVIIAQNLPEAEEAVRGMMEEKRFGKSGEVVVVEEFLTGPEVSVLAFTDSKTLVPMISSMDHKRALDGDQGLNTGGMGVIAPNPHYTPALATQCMETIFLPTMRAMNEEGRPFKGCLYFGLMLTPDGPKVIEYNCRFGDPEAQAVLPLLRTDLVEIMEAIHDERLHEVDIRWAEGASACVVMASGGYPGDYEKGLLIEGFDDLGQVDGAFVYHAGTKLVEGGRFLTNGGRVLGVTARGDTLPAALDRAYDAVSRIHFPNAHYRRDIGQK